MERGLFKPIMGLNINEKPCITETCFFDPDLDLLERIQAMPSGIPVTLSQGWILVQEDFHAEMFELKNFAKVSAMISAHWTAHLSRLGYQIVLDGSEYIL